jgi:leucyl aminopeptidase (aminopeptidase T)
MKKVWIQVVFSVACAALWQPSAKADDQPKKQSSPGPDALAKKLITQCARVKEGDLVQVSGGMRDIELLESLTVEASKLGANTIFTFTPSEHTLRRLLLEVPAKYDSRSATADMKLAEIITVMFTVDTSDGQDVFASVPADRLNAKIDAAMKVMETLLKRNVRRVHLGNGMYPTEARAKQFGVTKAELARQFFDALNVDYAKMQATGEVVRKTLAGGKSAHITTPDGTDLTVEIASRSPFVSDGVLSDDKLRKGGPACQVWLPAGEVYLTPVPGTAEGKVVVERMQLEGKEIRGLRLTLRKGKLTEMKAESGLERMQALFDAAGPGKDEFSFLDVGINPAVRLPKDSPVRLFMEAGAIAIGTGNNVWAGGNNKASFGVDCLLRGGTLVIDGTALVRDGVLHVQK